MQDLPPVVVPTNTRVRIGFALMLGLALCGLATRALLLKPDAWNLAAVVSLVSVGLIGFWRWLWFGAHVLRSRFFLHRRFPQLRAEADRVPFEDLAVVALVVPSYKEQPWITRLVMHAIALEARTLPRPVVLVLNSESHAANDLALSFLQEKDPGLAHIRFIPMIQSDGKRRAMADSLHRLAQERLPRGSVVALMDGDTELHPGALRRTLPFFASMADLGALTTDEIPVVSGSEIFSEWFHLRFAQRHLQMASMSLSGSVLCLTGRFSLFRAEHALDPSFAQIVADDRIDHWLWGRFRFLSGDDKSTWYWLLRRGHRMLYVPDVTVAVLESIPGAPMRRAYDNMRRWYGNMLRTNARAIAIGPGSIPPFVWWCLIDQRISMWTSLVTPGVLLIYALTARWSVVIAIAAWVVFSRAMMLQVIFAGRRSPLRPIHLPILVATQWVGSLIKIWTQGNLATQRWANRGGQSLDSSSAGLVRMLQVSTSRYLLGAQALIGVVVLLSLARVISPIQGAQGWAWELQYAGDSPPAGEASVGPTVWRSGFTTAAGLAAVTDPNASFGLQFAHARTDEHGQPVLRVDFPAGSASPELTAETGAPVGGAQLILPLGASADSAVVKYRLRFSPGFDFVKGGTLPGFYGGEATPGSDAPDGTNGFSTRVMWRERGDGEVYASLPTSRPGGKARAREPGICAGPVA